MEKLVYLLFQKAEFPGNQLREALLHEAAPALRAGGAHWISINVHDEDVVRPPPTGLERWEDLPSQRWICLLYTSPSPRDRTRSRMPSSA